MRFFPKIALIFLYFTKVSAIALPAQMQQSEAAKVEIELKMQAKNVQIIEITVQPKVGWHVYSAIPSPEQAYGAASISFDTNTTGFLADTMLREKGELIRKYDELMGGEVLYYEKKVVFSTSLKLKDGIEQPKIKGSFQYMGCNEQKCAMYYADFDLKP